MRALVTGANGFVGNWLVAHLRDQGDEVIETDREMDVTDPEVVRSTIVAVQPEAIYHLAALTHVGRSFQDPTSVLKVNAIGTLSVLEASRACSNPPRVLVISSAEVYGAVSENDLPLTEASPLAPVSPYAASKISAEFLAVQAHLAYGLPTLRVRPFNHVGPGQLPEFAVSALASRIVEAKRSGAAWISVGNLTARRDLTDVRDVVRGYRLLVTDGAPGAVYNICSGRAVAIQEIADRLLAIAGSDLELRTDPDLVRPVDVPVLLGDPSRIEKETGWKPEIDLDQTLADVLEEAERRTS
ncbi:MAG: GDP-mannose 4,6-dehydratase [Acidimicrobiales bacterium]